MNDSARIYPMWFSVLAAFSFSQFGVCIYNFYKLDILIVSLLVTWASILILFYLFGVLICNAL